METTTERRILDTRWALTEAVGGGGMSQVYRAIDLEQEHGDVAVKLLPAPGQNDRWAVKAFDCAGQPHPTCRAGAWGRCAA